MFKGTNTLCIKLKPRTGAMSQPKKHTPGLKACFLGAILYNTL